MSPGHQERPSRVPTRSRRGPHPRGQQRRRTAERGVPRQGHRHPTCHLTTLPFRLGRPRPRTRRRTRKGHGEANGKSIATEKGNGKRMREWEAHSPPFRCRKWHARHGIPNGHEVSFPAMIGRPDCPPFAERIAVGGRVVPQANLFPSPVARFHPHRWGGFVSVAILSTRTPVSRRMST